jgi:hypothetical protein
MQLRRRPSTPQCSHALRFFCHLLRTLLEVPFDARVANLENCERNNARARKLGWAYLCSE